MTDNVTRFDNVSDTPNEAVVAALENALSLAKAGKLRSIAMVGNMTENTTLTAFSGTDIPSTVGHLTFLAHTMMARQREESQG